MADHPLFHSFQEFVHKNHIIERGEKIIVSVSGGIDSMVLLDLFSEFKNRLKIEFIVAHFNHQLRGKESDEDEVFVRHISKERSIECYTESADTNAVAETEKLSIQEAARNLRYAFFIKLRQSIGFQKIATAHNADDNAETILLNLLRGTGIYGLTGIPVYRKDQLIIRPLLFATRERIQQYSTERNIEYREDSSNLKIDYTRNFIRHKLVPLIQENINPNFTTSLGRTSELFTQLEEYLKSELEQIITKVIISQTLDEIIINLSQLESQPLFLQELILFHLGKKFTRSEVDFNTVKTMLNILNSETGSSCTLSNNAVLYKDRDKLIFKHINEVKPFSFRIEVGKKYDFELFLFESTLVSKAEYTNNPNTEIIDADMIGKDLILRSWHEGDWFIPLGMKDKKKVSDLFVDHKIPLFEKHYIPLLISGGNIVWVCGMRLDNRYKITSKSKQFLKIQYSPRKK